ncbi:MAG: substrate-binding domain-containing protein, partial [Acidobacteriaceae bacterium]|nr:substrate-binding domain-containing protein [Acidobacteriaceae bacterium]
RLVGQSGKVAMVMQKPGGTSTVLREQGFAETMSNEFPGVRIAGRQYGMADPARSRAVAEDLLTAHPDLAGIFASSEAASIGSIQAIRARHLSRKVHLVTFDSSRMHVDALRDGTSDVMLVQDPFRLGYEAVKSLADKLDGKIPPKHVELPVHVIAKADLDRPDVRTLLKI